MQIYGGWGGFSRRLDLNSFFVWSSVLRGWCSVDFGIEGWDLLSLKMADCELKVCNLIVGRLYVWMVVQLCWIYEMENESGDMH